MRPLRGALLRSDLLALREADAERIRARPDPTYRAPPVEVDDPSPSSSWWRWAACAGRPTSWWYPARGDVLMTRAAVELCQGCGVRDACLAAALEEEAGLNGLEVCGIRGGKTGAERLGMLTARRHLAG